MKPRAGGSLWEETLDFKAATLTIWVTSTQKHTYKNRASTFYTSTAACSVITHRQPLVNPPRGKHHVDPLSEGQRSNESSPTQRGGDCCFWKLKIELCLLRTAPVSSPGFLFINIYSSALSQQVWVGSNDPDVSGEANERMQKNKYPERLNWRCLMGKIISSLSLRLLQRNVSGGAASGGRVKPAAALHHVWARFISLKIKWGRINSDDHSGSIWTFFLWLLPCCRCKSRVTSCLVLNLSTS